MSLFGGTVKGHCITHRCIGSENKNPLRASCPNPAPHDGLFGDSAFSLHCYAPWSVFHWQTVFGPDSDPYGFIEHVVTQSQGLFLAPQFIIIGIWLHFMKKLKGKADLHGSAHWATCEEIEKMG
ncbi:hypothetical protein LJC15_04505 [Desulfovibrio sp. OttesenSCG-928-G11]|nr:hypothetical protein [Desulfovibrio sp. OttesenSCG-928-G11]